jgi:TolA-binding protein
VSLGCAGHDDALRAEIGALRAEVQALRQDQSDLSRRVDALSIRADATAAKSGRSPARAGEASPAAAPAAPIVPPDLAVVKVAPQRASRSAPPVAVGVPIAEPDAARLEALGRRSGREIATEAEGELRAANARSGLDRAHALEDFAARYPRHPSADNALVDAARAYSEAGRDEAACSLARRAADDYPAGDAMSDALEVLASCAARRGGAGAERTLLERLVAEYPHTPAADRAGRRLAVISGHPADESAADGPPRSAP